MGYYEKRKENFQTMEKLIQQEEGIKFKLLALIMIRKCGYTEILVRKQIELLKENKEIVETNDGVLKWIAPQV